MKLTFYYREDCHLCDAMRKALTKFDSEVHPVDWQEVDIDRDSELIQRYDDKVPVLCMQKREICHYFLDNDALLSVLS